MLIYKVPNTNELFSTDDFRVKSNVLEPKIQFQKSTKFRFVLQGAYKDKRNEEKYGGQTSIYQKIGFETTYAVPGKGRLSCTFDYINNNYKSTDTKSSPVQFEMLEGLQVGTNYMWQLRYQQTFKNNLQANISYDGRSSPGTPVVHTAGVQVQLMF